MCHVCPLGFSNARDVTLYSSSYQRIFFIPGRTSRRGLPEPRDLRFISTSTISRMAFKHKFQGTTQAALAQFLILLSASATLSVIIFFVRLTSQAQTASSRNGNLSATQTIDVSTTLAIVSILQGLLTFVLNLALSRAFSCIQWVHVDSPRGASYLRTLAASPNSSALGTIRLIVHRSITPSARACGLGRLLLNFMVWLGGIVLFRK